MSSRSRSRSRSHSRSRSRSPRDRRLRSQRPSFRDAPYRRDARRGFSQSNVCNNYKQPGHFARECTNVAVCNNCGLPGHIAAECTTKSLCWNCREPGHMASNCSNEGICHACGKAGHRARECPNETEGATSLRVEALLPAFPPTKLNKNTPITHSLSSLSPITCKNHEHFIR